MMLLFSLSLAGFTGAGRAQHLCVIVRIVQGCSVAGDGSTAVESSSDSESPALSRFSARIWCGRSSEECGGCAFQSREEAEDVLVHDLAGLLTAINGVFSPRSNRSICNLLPLHDELWDDASGSSEKIVPGSTFVPESHYQNRVKGTERLKAKGTD
nr:hypothetical protein CFP56_50781 [Quercus suber]